MDLPRWSNLVALDAAYRDGESRLAAGPHEVYVEVAARCNLRCLMCPITYDPRYQPHAEGPSLFPEELFEQLTPILPTLERVYLQGLGEPTLHPRLVEFTTRMAAAGVEVWVTTNATLVDEELATALARAGLARVTVSLDGATASTYERIRVRGRFADLRRGLLALGEARRRHGRPALYLSLIGMASNLHEVDALVDLCAEVGGDGVSLEALYAWEHPDLEAFVAGEHLGHLDPGRVAALVEGARKRAESSGLVFWSRIDDIGAAALAPPPGESASPVPPAPDGAAAPALPFACSEPWATAVVNARGEVRTCCFNDEVLGNLGEATLDAIWNAAPYRELRRKHAAGEVPASCDHCVRSGRIRRSGVLSWRATVPAAERPRGEHLLAAPLDGELVGDQLVVFGRLPERVPWWRGRNGQEARAAFPELYVNDLLIARLGDGAIVERSRFAAVVPIGFVTSGAHELALRASPRHGGAVLARRHLQVARPELPPGDLAAVHTLALPFLLPRREGRPQVFLDGLRRPLAWLCGPYGAGWLGVALIDLDGVAAGEHRLELRRECQPATTSTLWRIAPR
jgi:MoaA/NifB/PqqE/SkfB family radical SAM enzyme